MENLVEPYGRKKRIGSLMRYYPFHQGDTWEDTPCVLTVDFITYRNVRSLGVTTVKG